MWQFKTLTIWVYIIFIALINSAADILNVMVCCTFVCPPVYLEHSRNFFALASTILRRIICTWNASWESLSLMQRYVSLTNTVFILGMDGQ